MNNSLGFVGGETLATSLTKVDLIIDQSVGQKKKMVATSVFHADCCERGRIQRSHFKIKSNIDLCLLQEMA